MGTGKVIGANRAYRGLVNNKVRESNFAEIVWFVRGTTLYRQARLIIGDDENLKTEYSPTDPTANAIPSGFHNTNDVSVAESNGKLFFNKLSDLAKRENRFAHHYVGIPTFPFPHDLQYRELRLPTMAELDGGFSLSTPITHPTQYRVDLWNNPNYAANTAKPSLSSNANGTGWLVDDGDRRGEDIVLTNVISFDIKVWNPDTNSFTNLGDGSNGAFGSQGRYSGGTGENEVLVQKVYFDENRDQINKYKPDDNDPDTMVENPMYHDISPDYPQRYLYQENNNGGSLPLSIVVPPSPPQPPASTLEIGAWEGNPIPMSRVFDTWTKWYESQLREGGEVIGLDLTKKPTPPLSTTAHEISGDNSQFTGTKFWLVTFGQTPNPVTQQGDRWYYLHSPNEHEKIIPGENPGDPPTITTELRADKFFETYRHPGTGIILSDKNSGKYWESPPPYDEVLRGVEITIRCFDPKSGNIRQVRIVKHVDL
jgi:hypothetical protein